jgi:hypothetical protein
MSECPYQVDKPPLAYSHFAIIECPYQVDKPPIGILSFRDHYSARDLPSNIDFEVLYLKIMASMFGDGFE